MSAINIGSQLITYSYQEPALSGGFDRLNRDIERAGIYAGGSVIQIASHDVDVQPFVAYLRSNDLFGDKGIRLQTLSNATINIPNGPSQTYTIYLTYSYAPSITNFADFSVRLASAPAVTNEVRICNVTNDGAGIITSIDYTTRMRGTIDVDNGDRLTQDLNPTLGYHVGNRDYNDLRYVNQNGPNTFDIQVLKTTDGTLGTSRIWFNGTAAREFELQDRSMVLADNRSAFQLGDIKSTIATITPTDLTPWLDISVNHPTLNASGAGSWPLLVPFLRNITTGTYNFTGYTPGATTILQMDSLDPTTAAFVLALTEDNLYHGDNVANYVNYKTMSFTTIVGDIPVGDYTILNINPISYEIEINVSTAGPTAAGTTAHYPFRIQGSTTTARWYKVEEASLATSNTETPLMFRVRDRSQKHKHYDPGHAHSGIYEPLALALGTIIGALYGIANTPTTGTYGAYTDMGEAVDSGTGAGTPRTGNTTRGKRFTVNKYLYGGVYTP